jgi:hypothetical protein
MLYLKVRILFRKGRAVKTVRATGMVRKKLALLKECQPGLPAGFRNSIYQWPFQEPKLEVPNIYKAYVRAM